MVEAHLSCLIIDLQGQFPGRSQDKGEWVLLTAAIPSIVLRVKCCVRQILIWHIFNNLILQYLSTVPHGLQSVSRAICVNLTQYWQQKSSSLARA